MVLGLGILKDAFLIKALSIYRFKVTGFLATL
jgi:hypothetical protein